MPNPKKEESESEYVSRFMNSEEAKRDFPDEKQRAAVAHSKWKRRKKKGRQMSGYTLQQVTCNIEGKGVRHEMLEGRRHLVAPVAMVVPGVLSGSAGPLLYPDEELGKEPLVWNHMPIVLNHPQRDGTYISARDPDIMNSRKLGVILNSKFDGKLRSEAWIDIDRTRQIEPKILQALNAGQMMEVSIGVYTDNEKTSGEFNGIKYDAVARNYRPDHLALLPEGVGACSIKDGAGLLQVNESDVSTIAGKIADQVKSLLKESKVDKKKVVTDLLAANSNWTESDREWLEGLSEDQLTKLSKPVTNANPNPDPAPKDDPAPDPGDPKDKTPSVNEFIANAPVEIRQVLEAGLEAFNTEKNSLIQAITANKANVFKVEDLAKKGLSELKAIAALAKGPEQKPVPGYKGAASFDPIGNAHKETPLAMPTMTFDRK